MKRLTKAQALSTWRKLYLPGVRAHYERDGRPDYPARSESWSSYTDDLCKGRQITLKQYESWSAPPECGK